MRTAKVVILGDSLLAKEIEEVFSGQAPEIEIEAAGVVEGEAILTERGGEPALIMGITEKTLASAGAIVLAGPAAASRRTREMWSALRGDRPAVIDLSYALEEQPGARLRAPLAETGPAAAGEIQLVAHPAAIVLSRFFGCISRRSAVRRWVAHIFEPASERGRPGVDELQQQTVDLLSFRTLPKEVFDEQLTFNLLARYGAEAPLSLQGVETLIERHLASLLAKGGLMPMASLRLIQAPVFHGYSFSVWVEFESNAAAAELADALAAAGIDVRAAGEPPPTNVGVAGQSGMTVGLIETDRNDPRCAWFWIVADNHRISADNALALTRQVLAAEEA
ncbi:MAG: hypothetical protein KIT09_23870 [Bryobacteraceae bacterium]|nr:hypothetical protein [Bryobacteraceae bacterium]